MSNPKRFLVINGPNLNMLGIRETSVYGSETLKEIQDQTEANLHGLNLGVEVDWFQSNSEGEIVSKIQETLREEYDGLVINPGAYSHTSIAILDALKTLNIPITEVHLSHTNLREDFRKKKVTAKAADGLIEGHGGQSYFLAIYGQLISNKEQ